MYSKAHGDVGHIRPFRRRGLFNLNQFLVKKRILIATQNGTPDNIWHQKSGLVCI